MTIPTEEIQQEDSQHNIEIQSSFAGGMNLVLDDTTLKEAEYKLAFNVRNRFNKLTAILAPKNITYGLEGKKQGLYSVGTYWVVFVAGKCYYKSNTGTSWTEIEDFQMSTTADRIYAYLVEGSTANYLRKQTSVSDISLVSRVNTQIAATPRAFLCQDGINQPWIITLLEDGSPVAREALTYNEWNNDITLSREYVPIGRDMMVHDGILYIVSADQRRLYRSVTGRPLDFVVNIDPDGYKGGDADTTAYAVDYGKITALYPLNAAAFLVATDVPATHVIQPNREVTRFGEPTFSRQPVFSTNALNSFSIVDILGDTCFIDSEGVKSFNAVLQLQNEGRNSVFSLKIAPLFKSLTQDVTSAFTFDNYALFSVKTIYGYAVVVYDFLNQVFAGVDMTDAMQIKQFASLNPYINTIACITQDDEIYELYQSATSEIGTVYTKNWVTGNPRISQTADELLAIFTEPLENGVARIRPYVDGKRVSTLEKDIRIRDGGITYPVEYPVSFDNITSVNNMTFKFTQPLQGWKIGYVVSWTGGATLNYLAHVAKTDSPIQSLQQSALYASQH